ncbi:MAG: DUF411 domain-containing protein [Pseudomonadales bacterium]
MLMNRQDKTDLKRRQFVSSLLCGAITVPFIIPARSFAKELAITVWKSPTCGCCKDWITYLEDNGFTVTSHDEGATDAMIRMGMPFAYGSCHTASIEGYAIEGHVPVREILRLLDERPDAVGISVPAMPRGSPGMDGPMYGGVKDPYDVLLIDHDGEATVFQSYR